MTKMDRAFSTLIKKPIIRWTITILWTVVTIKLMLSPSGDGTTVSWISKLFGGSEATDAVGHVLINGALAFFWLWTLSLYFSTRTSRLIVLSAGMTWSICGEIIQFFVPNRGTSWLDVFANLTGIAAGILAYRVAAWVQRRQHPDPDIATSRLTQLLAWISVRHKRQHHDAG